MVDGERRRTDVYHVCDGGRDADADPARCIPVAVVIAAAMLAIMRTFAPAETTAFRWEGSAARPAGG